MKKSLSRMLILFTVPALAACGASDDGSDVSPSNDNQSQEVQTSPAETEQSSARIVGNNTLGYLDLGDHAEKLKVDWEKEESIGLSSSDARATIILDDLSAMYSIKEDASLKDAADNIRNDLAGMGYQGINVAEFTIDGNDALQIYVDHTLEEFGDERFATVAYITRNKDGKYVSVTVRAPQEGWRNEDGSLYHPHILIWTISQKHGLSASSIHR